MVVIQRGGRVLGVRSSMRRIAAVLREVRPLGLDFNLPKG